MNLKALLFSAATALFAVPAMAQTQEQVDLFRSLIVENGCAMTEEFAEDYMPQYGFSKSQTRTIAGQMMDSGSAALENGVFILLDGECANGGEESGDMTGNIEMFIGIISEHGCQMTEADAETVFPANGMQKPQVLEVVNYLMENSLAVFEGGLLTVSSDMCRAANPVYVPPAGSSGSDVDQFLEVLGQNGCTLSAGDISTAFAETQIAQTRLFEIANQLVAEGRASMSGGVLTVDAASCPTGAGSSTDMAWYDQDDVMLVLSTLTQHDCRVSAADIGSVFANTGIEQTRIFEIANLLVAEGVASMTGGVLEVSSDACQVVIEQPVTITQPVSNELVNRPDVVAFLTVMEANNCAINAANVNSTFAGGDIDGAAAFGIINELVAASFAEIVNGSELVVSDAICRPPSSVYVPVTPDQPATGDLTARADVQEFLSVLAGMDCTIGGGEVDAVFAGSAITGNQAFAIFDELMAAGLADMDASNAMVSGGLTLTVLDSICPPAGLNGETTTTQGGMSDDMTTFLTVLSANNCQIAASDMSNAFASEPIDGSAAFVIANDLMAQGTAEVVNGVLIVSSSLCPLVTVTGNDDGPIVNDDADIAAVPLLERADVNDFISILADNGCAVGANDVNGVFGAAGMDGAVAFSIANELMNAGIAELQNGNMLVIDGDACHPSDGGFSDMSPEKQTQYEEIARLAEIAAAEAGAIADSIEALEPIEDIATQTPVPSFDAPSDVTSPIFENPNVRQFLAIMSANGCFVDRYEMRELFADAGMGSIIAGLTKHQLETIGVAGTDYETYSFVVAAPYCVEGMTFEPEDTSAGVEAADASGVSSVEAGHIADMAAAEAEMAARQAAVEAEIAAALVARIAEAEAEEMAAQAAAEAAIAEMLAAAVDDAAAQIDAQLSETGSSAPAFIPAADIDSPIFVNPNVVQFIEIIAANGCYVDYAGFNELFNDGGMSEFMANLTFHQLKTVGAATVDYNDWVYIVGAPYCIANQGAN